jgi:DNA-binding NarL/FixJ family response regulator
MRPTVVIVDDHAAFRRFARRALELDVFDVVAEAGDGASAIEQVGALRPDVVLLDIRLPDVDGFVVAEELAATAAPPRIVLTSSREASDFERRLRRTPAVGFLHKSELSGAALTALVTAR